jgi:hypothetical protein
MAGPNQPHPNQAPRPQSNFQETASAHAGSQIEDPREVKDEQEKKPLEFTAKNLNFKEVLAELISQVISNKITAQQSRGLLHTWYHSMSDEEKAEFVANRNDADLTLNYFKGVIETLAQELPYLLTGM